MEFTKAYQRRIVLSETKHSNKYAPNSERGSTTANLATLTNPQFKANNSLKEPTMQTLTRRQPLPSAPNSFTQNGGVNTSRQNMVTRPQGKSELTREHLLERVTLLERLMALRAEEEALNNEGNKGC